MLLLIVKTLRISQMLIPFLVGRYECVEEVLDVTKLFVLLGSG